MDLCDELLALLKEAGINPSFDMGRNITHPCTYCARSDVPLELVTIGTYFDGSSLTRPVCGECLPMVRKAKG